MVSKDKEKESSKESQEADVEELNALLDDIHSTAEFVHTMIEQHQETMNSTMVFDADALNEEIICSSEDKESEEERYVNEMIQLQFGMIQPFLYPFISN